MFSGFRSRCVIPAACAATEAFADLCSDIDELACRNRPSLDQSPQGLAFDQLSDNVRNAVLFADVMHDDDIKACAARGVPGEVRRQDLERDFTAPVEYRARDRLLPFRRRLDADRSRRDPCGSLAYG